MFCSERVVFWFGYLVSSDLLRGKKFPIPRCDSNPHSRRPSLSLSIIRSKSLIIRVAYLFTERGFVVVVIVVGAVVVVVVCNA